MNFVWKFWISFFFRLVFLLPLIYSFWHAVALSISKYQFILYLLITNWAQKQLLEINSHNGHAHYKSLCPFWRANCRTEWLRYRLSTNKNRYAIVPFRVNSLLFHSRNWNKDGMGRLPSCVNGANNASLWLLIILAISDFVPMEEMTSPSCFLWRPAIS